MNLLMLLPGEVKTEEDEEKVSQPEGEEPARIAAPSTSIALSSALAADDPRAKHMRKHLKLEEGDSVKVGVVDRGAGEAVVHWQQDGGLLLALGPLAPPPTRPRVQVLLCHCFPRVLKRLWPEIVSMSVERLVLTGSQLTDKAYWLSCKTSGMLAKGTVLGPQFNHVKNLPSEPLRHRIPNPALVLEGLAQGADTRYPAFLEEPSFEAFMASWLDKLAPKATCMRLMFDLGDYPSVTETLTLPWFQQASQGPQGKQGGGAEEAERPLLPEVLVALGPERGWTDAEVDLLRAREFHVVAMGRPNLRVDTALISAVALVQERLRTLHKQARAPPVGNTLQ